ncbi:MAG: hypothetical protein AAF620_16885 [Bacteroidota bacterium]
MKKILAHFFVLCITISCTSFKKYSDISQNLSNDKEYVFTLTRSSDDKKIVKIGPNLGETKTPSNRAMFERSIVQIAADTNLNISFSNYELKNDTNQIRIKSEIKSIEWKFAMIANMFVEMEYEVDSKKYYITGNYKKWSGGTKTESLLNSIQDANYQLLKTLSEIE